jgi:branched-chain amino acid transport system permease protein
VLAISQLQVNPGAVFSVQWTAEMAFATITGGLGTIEGPILGTAVYMIPCSRRSPPTTRGN